MTRGHEKFCDGLVICGLIVECRGKRFTRFISADETIKLAADQAVHHLWVENACKLLLGRSSSPKETIYCVSTYYTGVNSG